jgi:iron complex outermembrane receptor protein
MKLKLLQIQGGKLLLLGLLMVSGSLFAQRTVSGTITDGETGVPLVGASVIAIGTSTGTIADIDGTFSLQLPAGINEVEVSYTGYTSQKVDASTTSSFNIKLVSGTALNEVVVIGYGTVKREDATGSVETVSSKEFNKGAISSAQELVAGKVAGVQITNDGSPGGGATIRIRGGSSLSASNDPLIVIDGVPLPTDGVSGSRNPLNLVNPNDIETFTVLKDASAAAIYGSRASNGVIIITTKKGKAGSDLALSYNGSIGSSSIVNEYEVLSSDAFRGLITDRFGEGSTEASLLGEANSDWQDVIYQNALFHNHNISATGAIKSLPYRVSVGYTSQDGVLLTDKFQRITYGLNLTPSFFENRLQVNVGVKGVNTQNNFANRGAISSALRFDPTQEVFADNQFGGYNYVAQNGNTNPNTLAPSNPLALLEQTNNESKVNRYIANFTADYRFSFLPALRANLNMAIDRSQSNGFTFIPTTAAFAFDADNGGGVDNTYSQEKNNELLEFYLNYNKEFDGFRLDILGGYSWQNFFRESAFSNNNLAGTEPVADISPEEYYLLSLFSRVNLGIGDRLNVTATLRRDGSSRFSEANRWGLFPSAAVAYRLIDVDNNPKGLNSLKFRAGYGVTGQQEAGGYYPSQALYLSSFDNARYSFGDRFINTLRPQGYNANLKWEETATLNLAVDFGFFNDRLNGAVEVYQRKTSDLLNFIPVPAGTNLTNFITSNVGDLENRGVEFSVNAIPYQKDNSQLSIGLNLTFNQNEITKLTATEDPSYQGVATGGIAGGVGNTAQIHSVGFPASSFFVYEQVYDESGTPIEGVYVDRNQDGVVNTDDLYRYKDPAADAFLGFTVNYELNNFDLSFAGRANFGNYVYDNLSSTNLVYSGLVNSTGFLSNSQPAITAVDFQDPQLLSDYFVRDASFVRLDHITAGYRFADLVGKGSSVRTFVTIQNPIVITNYEGIDPEVFGGIDNNIYPRSRTILLGVGVNF